MFVIRRSSKGLLSKAVRCAPISVRAFSITPYNNNNMVEELYLKELKSTNFDMSSLQSPESIKENVIEFNAPGKPKLPVLEATQKENLTTYIKEGVETGLSAEAKQNTTQKEAEDEEEDWLVIEEDEEEPAHH